MEENRRALVTVTEKKGVGSFGKGLQDRGFTVYSTGGTAVTLRESGVNAKEVSEITGFPEGMDGRLKTIHPLIEGGLLGNLDKQSHRDFQEEHGIKPIQVVVVNLYDFKGAIAAQDVTLDKAVEQIDIGGPTLIRAAAKNYRHCLPVVDPADYQEVLNQLDQFGLNFPLDFRIRMLKKAFRMTKNYDATISNWLDQQCDDPLADLG